MNPYFSIVIPAKNEEAYLPILLNSLANQTDKDFEVIVSDDNSTDKTSKVASSFQDKLSNLQIISHKSCCVAKGRNLGAQKAVGEYLIFLDADVEISPNFITDIKNKIQKYNARILTVWYRPKNTNFIGKLTLFLFNLGMEIAKHIKPLSGGACIIIKNSLFIKIKGFDETIVYCEDSDLIQRASQQKEKFYVFSKPKLYVSTRRYDKEGFLLTTYKAIKANYHILFIGPIRKPLFRYEMGGQYFRKK